MTDEKKIKVTSGSEPHVALWLMGWLFTIGYVKLSFWPAVAGLFIWPYYLGMAVR